ncbi:unnamed protein product [Gadus morhua 'NCC']
MRLWFLSFFPSGYEVTVTITEHSVDVSHGLARAGPLMKQRVSDSVRLIGQVCPGLRLPAFEVSSEAPPRQPNCSRSSSSAVAAAAATTATRLRLTPAAQTATAPPDLAPYTPSPPREDPSCREWLARVSLARARLEQIRPAARSRKNNVCPVQLSPSTLCTAGGGGGGSLS